jgi:hypothetical protein
MEEEYRETFVRRIEAMLAALPGGAQGYAALAQRPGYAVGMGLAAMSDASEKDRQQHIDELLSLAGNPAQPAQGDNDEAAGALFLENLRAGLASGQASEMEAEVMRRLEMRANERATTLLGLLGSMMNTFHLARKGESRW